MTEEMVMRSVYLRPSQDGQLRDLARELDVTKSDLIRGAIHGKLMDWARSNDREHILNDVKEGLRDETAKRRGRPRALSPSPELPAATTPKSFRPAKTNRNRGVTEATSAADSPGQAHGELA